MGAGKLESKQGLQITIARDRREQWQIPRQFHNRKPHTRALPMDKRNRRRLGTGNIPAGPHEIRQSLHRPGDRDRAETDHRLRSRRFSIFHSFRHWRDRTGFLGIRYKRILAPLGGFYEKHFRYSRQLACWHILGGIEGGDDRCIWIGQLHRSGQ